MTDRGADLPAETLQAAAVHCWTPDIGAQLLPRPGAPQKGASDISQEGAYGPRIGRHFRIYEPPTLVANPLRNAPLAVTRLRSESSNDGLTTPIPRERAFVVIVQLRDPPLHELWIKGSKVPAAAHARDSISVVDLDLEPAWRLQGPFDLLHFYLPRAALDELADQNDARRVDGLSVPPGVAVRDPVVAQLASCLLPFLEQPGEVSKLLVDRVVLALAIHVAQKYGGMKFGQKLARGGLALWQERRAKEFMLANLQKQISVAQVASTCSLSCNHFARAFRHTTGLSPHRWRLEQRIERAKDLLRNSPQSLVDIALSCGFADQSHFTRVFSGAVGTAPGAWRRGEACSAMTTPPQAQLQSITETLAGRRPIPHMRSSQDLAG